MGCKSSKSKAPTPPPPSGSVSAPVTLNVYDLTPSINKYMYWFGFGIFHSGIEVYGMEYGFGAHDYPTTGVFEVDPKSCPGFSYRRSILLGYTNMLPFEFREFIDNLASDYHGDSYHLILKNCNHFTQDASMKLTGKSIPKWVNRVAHLSAMCCCLLPKTLRIEAVKGEPAYHGLIDDGSDSFSVISPETTNGSHVGQENCRFFPSPDSEMGLIEEVHISSKKIEVHK